MSCKSCRSTNQKTFPAEICIHFPGLRDLTRSSVLVFPSLLVCSNCGFTEFVIGEAEMGQLMEADSSNNEVAD
jgi:hypothetical protein